MIKGIDKELASAIKGVANIFPSGDIEGLLRGKAEGILGIASVFNDCDIFPLLIWVQRQINGL